MTDRFLPVAREIREQVDTWEPRLRAIPEEVRSARKNRQERTVKQIVGHLVDSATNNTHRIVHLQNLNCHLPFPDYANKGSNDRWIEIQRYQEESWEELVDLWASANRHLAHLIGNVDERKLERTWVDAHGQKISLEAMILDYPRHFKLHLGEIEAMLNGEHA